MLKVAVIEDDPAMRARLIAAIDQDQRMEIVGTAANVAQAEAMIAAGGYDVLLCDLGLPDGNGIPLIGKAARANPDVDVLVITVFANQTSIIDAIRAGARGYLLKDETTADYVEAILEVRRGGSPISPIIARRLLDQIKPQARDSNDGPSLLSDREFEVLRLLARGFSNGECAGILKVSAHTIGSHVKKIYAKLSVNNRAEALFEASSRGLLER